MNYVYLHERHEMYHNPMTTYPSRRPLSPQFLPLLGLVVALLVSDATAAPVSTKVEGGGSLLTRAENSTMAPTRIWVPVFVVAMIVLATAMLIWSKGSRGLCFSFGRFSTAGVAGQASTTTLTSTGAREVTADQLTGGVTNNTTTSRPRRSRRPRRTPSQISTTSLPAYNKEPGEEELVIFRGQEMEDVTMPTTVVMPALEEDGDGESSMASDTTSRYSPLPPSPNNMPLLDGHRQESRDGISGSDTASSLRREDSNLIESPDPRGMRQHILKLSPQKHLKKLPVHLMYYQEQHSPAHHPQIPPAKVRL
ncbi:hypothetical protein BD779DRAFT_1132372 [Infundibulicybe gibba]|nr:hypothetical protein BD779DRAFT_1132372 [Infundibulicybe gibba]